MSECNLCRCVRYTCALGSLSYTEVTSNKPSRTIKQPNSRLIVPRAHECTCNKCAQFDYNNWEVKFKLVIRALFGWTLSAHSFIHSFIITNKSSLVTRTNLPHCSFARSRLLGLAQKWDHFCRLNWNRRGPIGDRWVQKLTPTPACRLCPIVDLYCQHILAFFALSRLKFHSTLLVRFQKAMICAVWRASWFEDNLLAFVENLISSHLFALTQDLPFFFFFKLKPPLASSGKAKTRTWPKYCWPALWQAPPAFMTVIITLQLELNIARNCIISLELNSSRPACSKPQLD